MNKIYIMKINAADLNYFLGLAAERPWKEANQKIVSLVNQQNMQDRQDAAAEQQAMEDEAKKVNDSGAQDGLTNQEAGDHHEA